MGAALKLTTNEWQRIDTLRKTHSWADIAARYGMNVNTLRGYNAKRKPRGMVLTPKPTAWNEREVIVPTFADDMPQILDAIAGLRRLGRPALVGLFSDHHFGDHDPRAIALHVEIERELQPDMTVDYGDVGDLATLSNFPLPAGAPRASALSVVYPPYMQYTDARCEASPDTKRVHITGNHDARVKRRADEAWFFEREIQEAWAALIRAGNRVMWAGWKEEIDIHWLNVRHGQRTNMHAAKSTVETDLAYGMSVIFGHTHRFGAWMKTQKQPDKRRRVIQAYNIGYAGNNPPAYEADAKDSVDWIRGCAFAHVWMDDFIVDIKPVIYHETRKGGMVCAVGSKIIEVDKYGRRVS